MKVMRRNARWTPRSALVLVVLLSAGFWVRAARAENPYQALKLFTEVLELVRRKYVEDVRREPLMMSGLRGLLDGLDSYTLYLDDLRHQRHLRPGPLSFPELGLCLGLRGGRLVVVSPLPASAAARAGIRPGDTVAELGGTTTAGISLREALAGLAGSDSIELQLWRSTLEHTVKVELVQENAQVKPVHLALPEGVGYVRPGWIVQGTGGQSVAAVEDLVAEGVEALILDLRWSPGEDLVEAAAIADVLVEQGDTLGYVIDRGKDSRVYYTSDHEPLMPSAPVVALVGPGTCCAGELLAASLKDLRRAVLIGGETFGKGTLQLVIPLDSRSGVALTHSRWYTPTGMCIDRQLGGLDPASPDTLPGPFAGVTPHLAVAPDPGTALEASLRATGMLSVRGCADDEIPELLEAHGFVFLPTEHMVDSARAVPGNTGEPIFGVEERDAAISRIAEELRRPDEATPMSSSLQRDPVVQEALAILADRDRYQSLLEPGPLPEHDTGEHGE